MPSFERGSQRAGAVIIALERYRQGWGKHPQTLQQLVPDFLPAAPKPGWRYQYQYRWCEKEGVGYILYFMARDGRHCGFISKRAAWLCGDYDSSLPFHGETPCSN